MDMGEWLKECRQMAQLSYAETTYRLRAKLPPSMWVSLETIRRMEKRSDPDPVLAAALAKVYGVDPKEWPEALREEIELVSATIGDTGRLLSSRAA